MEHKQLAIQKFEEGYNCAQAVACCYAQELGMDEEVIYRLIEGFGGGFAHSGHICGTLSGLTMVESYRACQDNKQPGSTKEATYEVLRPLLSVFEQQIGHVDCKDILANGDETLINGKKACCRACVETACQLLDQQLMKG